MERVALLIKHRKPTARSVIEYLDQHFLMSSFSKHDAVMEAEVDHSFPDTGSPDILISYLSPWVVPAEVLSRTKLWNINFHPGPPEYPGIGCYNFALKDDVKTYGVTAHLMNPEVDTGKIISVKRFSVLPTDTVYSLSIKSYGYMYAMFLEVIDYIIERGTIPTSYMEWKREPYTRKELNELCDASKPDDRWVKYP